LKSLDKVPCVLMPKFDAKTMLQEDSIDNLNGTVKLRFAKTFDVAYNFNNSGIWDTLPNGEKVWLS